MRASGGQHDGVLEQAGAAVAHLVAVDAHQHPPGRAGRRRPGDHEQVLGRGHRDPEQVTRLLGLLATREPVEPALRPDPLRHRPAGQPWRGLHHRLEGARAGRRRARQQRGYDDRADDHRRRREPHRRAHPGPAPQVRSRDPRLHDVGARPGPDPVADAVGPLTQGGPQGVLAQVQATQTGRGPVPDRADRHPEQVRGVLDRQVVEEAQHQDHALVPGQRVPDVRPTRCRPPAVPPAPPPGVVGAHQRRTHRELRLVVEVVPAGPRLLEGAREQALGQVGVAGQQVGGPQQPPRAHGDELLEVGTVVPVRSHRRAPLDGADRAVRAEGAHLPSTTILPRAPAALGQSGTPPPTRSCRLLP